MRCSRGRLAHSETACICITALGAAALEPASQAMPYMHIKVCASLMCHAQRALHAEMPQALQYWICK